MFANTIFIHFSPKILWQYIWSPQFAHQWPVCVCQLRMNFRDECFGGEVFAGMKCL